MSKRINIYLMAVMVYIAAAAQSFTVIPPRNAIEGERFQVVYRVTDGQGSGLKAPQINGCTLLYGPSTSTSYSTQIINGVASSSSTVDYSFIYRADKAGTFTIPASSVNVDGKTLTADAKKFTVLPADRKSSQGGATLNDPDSKSADKPISKDDIFVRIILNKSSVYEQEAIECTLKLYTKYEAITSFSADKPAVYDGFLIEDVPQASQTNQVENFNGQNYRTAILRKCIIFPQQTGKLTISSGSYDVTIQQLERINQGYFYMTRPVERTLKLQPYTASVNVKPLPQPQPAGFNGAVGRFSVKSDLSSNKVKTGEAATMSVTVNGSGNIKYLKIPDIDFPSSFELYNPTQNFDTHVSGSTVTGTMTAEYIFSPESVGKFDIPTTPFVYFDPASGQYVTLEIDGYSVDVLKGSRVATATDRRDVEVKNTDILHIKLGDKHLSKEQTFYADNLMYWLIYPVLLGVFILIVLLNARRIKANADVAGRKVARANKVARKRLSLAEKAMKSGSKEEFYDAVLKAVWGYLGDKLSIPVSELRRDNITDELLKYGASEAECQKVITVLDECEMARYTPDSSVESLQNIFKDAVDVMKQLENRK